MSERLKPKSLLLLKTIHENAPERWLYTRELARLAKVSTSTASTELRELAKSGILVVKEEGREKSYRINLANAKARKLRELFETERREEFFKRNRRLSWTIQDFTKHVFDFLPQIQFMILFGSAVRGQLSKTGDIDLLAVIPAMEQEAFNQFMKSIDSIAADVRARYGFPLSLVTMNMKDFETAVLEKKRIAQDVLHEGIVLFGEERYYQLLSRVVSRREDDTLGELGFHLGKTG